MAKSLATMRENYQAAGAFANQAYQAGIGSAEQEWVAGMTQVLGHPPGPTATAKYRAGIQRGASNYHMGDPDKFIRKYSAAMSR